MFSNKKGCILGLFRILIIVFIIFWLLGLFYSFIYSNPCLEDIAKDFCENNDMIYSGIDYLGNFFYCNLNEREISLRKFSFLEEEIKSCKK